MHRDVLSRIDPDYHIKMPATTSSVTFVNAFFNPTLISTRSPVNLPQFEEEFNQFPA